MFTKKICASFVSAAILSLALTGCDRFRSSDQGTHAAKKAALKSSNWLSGMTLGCAMRSGDFFVFRFDGHAAYIDGERPLDIAAMENRRIDGFSLSTKSRKFDFGMKRGSAMSEGHMMVFQDNGKDFPCFFVSPDGYIPTDGSIAAVDSMFAQWNCGGDIGSILFDRRGRFARSNKMAGEIVFSGREHSPSRMTAYLLGDVRKSHWVGSFEALSLDASQAASGQITLGGQKCTKG